jgi:hypothetical protein
MNAGVGLGRIVRRSWVKVASERSISGTTASRRSAIAVQQHWAGCAHGCAYLTEDVRPYRELNYGVAEPNAGLFKASRSTSFI